MEWDGSLARAQVRGTSPGNPLGRNADPLIEAQVAALGRSDRPWRAVVRASSERDRVGLVIGADEALPGEETFVIDGPIFTRRVDVVAGDIIPDGGRWRVGLGIRGC